MSSGQWEKLQSIADAEVQATMKSLPQHLREEARQLPVTYEPRPNPAMMTDGTEPDTLGLFVGPEFSESESGRGTLPPQIILFLENLWGFADEDETIFRQEIRTTLLHELGHYLGLDEGDLEERGLE